jgi:hypothetical protein
MSDAIKFPPLAPELFAAKLARYEARDQGPKPLKTTPRTHYMRGVQRGYAAETGAAKRANAVKL